MLVLSRKKNESIVIDGRITVTIVAVKKNQIRLGIEAAKEIPVHRAEVVLRDAGGESDSALLASRLSAR